VRVATFEWLCRSLPLAEWPGDERSRERVALFELLGEKSQAHYFADLGLDVARNREALRLDQEVKGRPPKIGREWERQGRPRLRPATRSAGGSCSFERGAPDVLLDVDPPEYVELLAGVEVPARGGMIHCPLPGHEDRTPSCWVFEDAPRGWYCHGCHRGGSIYDLASELSGIGTRGDEFKELRRWIAGRLLTRSIEVAA
jgi:hypothetical protein